MNYRVTSQLADLCCAIEYKDKNHNWGMYSMNLVEAALRKHGVIGKNMYYKRFDTDIECLEFGDSMHLQYKHWDLLVFRLKIADIFYKLCLKCHYYFQPKLDNEK